MKPHVWMALATALFATGALAQPSEPAGADSDALTDAELEALGLTSDGSGVDTRFHFSGFADFTLFVPIKPTGVAGGGANGAGGKHTQFSVGNFNLYLSKNLSESFRTMAEVRLTYLPNGSKDPNPSLPATTSTDVADYANNGYTARWGGIIIQRIYLDWNVHSLLTIRGGQFLTPYGIWNVDHGSPAYIPVQRPYAIGNNWFPERQTGFELFGRAGLGRNAGIGYHLTVSNGTGPVSEYRDFDDNKAVGARLFVEHHGAGYLRTGASGYYGRDTDAALTFGVDSKGVITTGEDIERQYDALALAADVQYKHGGLILQGEWVSQQRRYTAAGRHLIPETILGTGQTSDAFSWAAYGLLGYQLPWWALTPYAVGQYDREILLAGSFITEVWIVQGGVNLHPVDAVTFKIEYLRAGYLNSDVIFGDAPYHSMQFQAAWAF